MRFDMVKGKMRVVALGVGMAAAIAFGIYSLMAHSKKEMPATPIPSEQTTMEKMSENDLLDVPEVTVKKSPPEKAWGRDPFEFPSGVELMVAGDGESPGGVKPLGKKLTAILISDSRKLASINDKMVEVGDVIDGEKVLEIKPDRVILEKSGRKYVIMLENPPWSMDKE